MKPYFENDLITLYHGDCLEHSDSWAGADVLVTDPPYGISYGKSGMSSYSSKGRVSSAVAQIANDDSIFCRDNVLNLWGSKPAIVFGSWRAPRPDGTKHRLIWWKQGQAPGPVNMAFMTQDEEIYILGEGWKKSSPPMRSVLATKEGRAAEVAKIGHPTPKPVALMRKLIDRCPPGVIADPFAGSGSTLVACQELGRKAIGFELEEKYCEIIAKRLAQEALPLGI